MKEVYSISRDGIILHIKVVPRASKNEVIGIMGDRLKVKIKAPPVDGEANAEIIRFFSKLLGIPKKQIKILRGLNASSKDILFYNMDENLITRIL